MRMSVITSIALRPMRSPKWPARNAPRGRKRKLTPTVANEMIVAACGPAGAKKSWPKTSPAALA